MDTLAVRKEKNIYRPDMLHTMMQVRDGTLNEGKTNEGSATAEKPSGKANAKGAWNDAEIVSNAFVFFVAG